MATRIHVPPESRSTSHPPGVFRGSARCRCIGGVSRSPSRWREVSDRSAGPFATTLRYEHPDGRAVAWRSRWRRKHASLLSRAPAPGEQRPAPPSRASWWIAVLFIVGSACFFVAPFRIYFSWVGGQGVALTFFVGSLFFTTAAALQWLETINAARAPGEPRSRRLRLVSWEPRRIDWWASWVQLVGTLFFNVTTFRGLTTTTEATSYDQVVWRPDALGCICFLVSGYLAFVEVTGRLLRRPPRTIEGGIVSVNLFGCVAFGVSALAGYVLPATGSLVAATVANVTTSVGGLAFLVGAVLLLPEDAAIAPP